MHRGLIPGFCRRFLRKGGGVPGFSVFFFWITVFSAPWNEGGFEVEAGRFVLEGCVSSGLYGFAI